MAPPTGFCVISVCFDLRQESRRVVSNDSLTHLLEPSHVVQVPRPSGPFDRRDD